MSRHTIEHPQNSLTLSYGYDRPLQHYFYEIRDSQRPADDPNDQIVEQSDLRIGASRDAMLNKLVEFGMEPEHDHLSSVLFDLPIDQ